MSGMRRYPVPLVLLPFLAACAPEPPVAYDPVTMDPPVRDTIHPPLILGLRVEVEGAGVNGLAYLAQGEGPHPTVLLLAGYPGHERSLDVAQAVRRAGVNVITLNYRGTWGSGGEMSLRNALEDARAALDLLRSEVGERRYRADPDRLALLGHSLGSWVALTLGAQDPGVDCVGGLATTNMGYFVRLAGENDAFREGWRRSIRAAAEGDGPVKQAEGDPVAEMLADSVSYDLALLADVLAPKAILLVGGTSDQEAVVAFHHAPLVAALKDAGATRLTEVLLDTDHAFSSARIALAREVVGWLKGACGY